MSFPEILLWLLAAVVAYTYFGYPLLLALVAQVRPRRRHLLEPAPRSVSIVIAAHNEEVFIDRRLSELSGALAASGLTGEVIVVSDGSTDATAALAQLHAKAGVRVLELPENLGKAVALTEGCAAATHEIICFADVRQSWDADALPRLLDNFRDPMVGAVSGDLVVSSAPGVLSGVGLYWRLEKWLRRQESRIHSTVGVTGAISAVRRELFRPIPAGTILDDVYWPLAVVMQGYRVLHDGRARAYDQLPEKTGDEFRRKVRTLSGNFQLLTRLPTTLVPWRNPVWLQFVSHKLARLVAPWALIGILLLSAILPAREYQLLFWIQVAFYLLGLLGLLGGGEPRPRVMSAAGSFLVLNCAAWLAFWMWVSGKTDRTWRKVAYKISPLGYTGS